MANYQTLSDEELIVLLRQGDQRAFTQIYERYFGILYIHALKLLKQEHEAEDIIHELFINLWIKAIKVCKKAMTKLKNYVSRYAFVSIAEEVHFFKTVKPQFYSKCPTCFPFFRSFGMLQLNRNINVVLQVRRHSRLSA